MIDRNIREKLLDVLDRLPIERQRRVLDYAHGLEFSLPKGVVGKDLLQFSGTMITEDVQAMSEAIQRGCEQVDQDEW